MPLWPLPTKIQRNLLSICDNFYGTLRKKNKKKFAKKLFFVGKEIGIVIFMKVSRQRIE